MKKIECLNEIKKILEIKRYNNHVYRLFMHKQEYHYIENEYYTEGLSKKGIVTDDEGNERIEFIEENQKNIEMVSIKNIDILIEKELSKND